jgi:hypothetical protein
MDQATRQETREAQTGLLAEHKVLKNKLWKLTGLVWGGDTVVKMSPDEENRVLCYKWPVAREVDITHLPKHEVCRRRNCRRWN